MKTAWKLSVFRVSLVLVFLYSVQMPKNSDQKNSEYRHVYAVELLEIADDHSNARKTYNYLSVWKE